MIMNRTQVNNLINKLSNSQGFYGRLRATLNEVKQYDKESYDNFFKQFKDCKDEVEVIMKLEG